MLVQFKLKNFMSVRNEQVFSFVAAKGLREKDRALTGQVVSASDGLDVLTTAAVYGANASGKSNLLRAMNFYVDSILLSTRVDSAIGAYSPFVLDQQSAAEPTSLEAVFWVDNVLYRYGFEIFQQTVVSEWLFLRRKQETYVFERSAGELRVNRPYKKLQELQSNNMVAPTALLLPLGALFNDETCQAVQTWASKVQYVESTEDYRFKDYTVAYLEKPENKQRVLDLVRSADLGIEDIELVPAEIVSFIISSNINSKWYGGGDWPPSNPSSHISELTTPLKEPYPQGAFKKRTAIKPTSSYTINTTRTVWDEEGNQFKSLSMPLKTFESQGTQKFFNLIGLILFVLDNGGLLIADELDTQLHPLLTQRIVQLFNSPVTNPLGAQFVFATHDTNLLSAGLFRRDQIWFTEKDAKGATQLYALTDYRPGGKTVRNDEQLEKNYVAGKYGGIPYLGDFDALFEAKPSATEPAVHE
jgi:hypothetical protein